MAATRIIQGVENPEIVNDTEEFVRIAFHWFGKNKFWGTREHLLKYGLAPSDIDYYTHVTY